MNNPSLFRSDGITPGSAIWRRMFLCICLLVFATNLTRAQVEQPQNAKEATTPGSGTGEITGRVVSADGRPLPDTMVSVYKAYARPGPPQALSTDSDGRFTVRGLAPGLYSVRAWLPGFAQPELAGESLGSEFYRLGDSVTLTLMKGGVITGTVRDSSGQPVVAIPVRLQRVRDANGRPITTGFSYVLPRMTDDRGIYRIYSLLPGTYIVSAGGSLGYGSGVSAYESDAPTYYPSSTRDTAAEVPVRPGEEAPSIDIRYRAERGHIVSGTIAGALDSGTRIGISVMLKQAASGGFEASTFVLPGSQQGFSFSGVADGVYEVSAQQGANATTGNGMYSAPQRVTVRGADVTGIQLRLASLGSIAGRGVLQSLEKQDGCEGERPATMAETLINAQRDEKSQVNAAPSPFRFGGANTQSDQGDFTIHNLNAGSYRLTARLPHDFWYLRSIVLPGTPSVAQPSTAAKSAAAKTAAPAPSVILLKAGENLTGITVNISQDGASIRGRIVNEKDGAEGAPPPGNLKIYVVPTERERAEDVLRYSEASVGSDGAFTVTNLPPGRYWLFPRPVAEDEPVSPRPIAWDVQARTKLRREAEAASDTLELRPCQRVNDRVVRWGAPPVVTKP